MPGTEAGRRVAAVVAVSVVTALVAAYVGLTTQIAQPMVHDEFSYLLAADTFRHGRLSNPAHPHAAAFETIHVLETPTYASKYPPAQGFFLWLGRAVSDPPIVGVWLGTAGMAGAIVWMLLGFLPLRWAVIGGGLAAARFGVVGPWAHTYWGGAVAALFGALALGAAIRLLGQRRSRDAVVLAVGLLGLANSRPFEGLLLAIPIAVALAFQLQRPPGLAHFVRRVALPTAGVLVLGLVWMGHYNARITGNPLQMPYALYEQRSPVPLFTFQSLAEPSAAYSHKRLAKQHIDFAMETWEMPRAISWLAPEIVESRLIPSWQFFLGWLWTVPLLWLPFVWKRPVARLLLACIAIELAGTVITTFANAHYLAPMTAAVVGLVVACLREVDRTRLVGQPVGRWAVVAFLAMATLQIATRKEEHVQIPSMWNRLRAGVEQSLVKTPHSHLILVEYADDHSIVAEWVYNQAAIDESPVVWARSRGEEPDRKLADYFPERQIWRLLMSGGARLGPHPLGRDRGPFPFDRVAGDWVPRDGWDAVFGSPH